MVKQISIHQAQSKHSLIFSSEKFGGFVGLVSKCSVPADMCSSQFARGSFSLLRLERNLSGSGQILQSDAMLLVQCAQRFAVMIIKISDPWWIKKAQNPPICWDLWWFIQRRKHGKKTSGFRGSNLPGIPYHPCSKTYSCTHEDSNATGSSMVLLQIRTNWFPENSPSKSTNQSKNQQILTMLGMIPMMCQTLFNISRGDFAMWIPYCTRPLNSRRTARRPPNSI